MTKCRPFNKCSSGGCDAMNHIPNACDMVRSCTRLWFVSVRPDQ